MARTAVTSTKVVPAVTSGGLYGTGGDLADPAGTTIDATLVTNGVALTCTDPKNVLVRCTNTSGAGKQLIVRRPASSQDGVATSAGGPGDWTTQSIPLTTGVRVFTLPPGCVDASDGTVHIDFQAGHTGTIQFYEIPA